MLKLNNTMSRRIETFKPRNDGQVKMFTCGPSIYRRPHVGNYRSFLWEDVLQRYLELLGYRVERVINFTDVEDKAIAEAKKEGAEIKKLTNSIAEQFFKDAELLKIKLPEYIPRSSTSVDQAVHLIKTLLKKGYAYWHENDIFFDPLKFDGFGKLFRLDMKRWPKEKKRFKRDTYPGRRWNLGDFILWHGYKNGDLLHWDTEIGKGRPSWNIQDPAMITKHLGYQIDIACGGIDNIYRHHDYNIAVIEAVSGKEFSRYWLHGEHLLVDGKKMSKSRGNIIYPDDLLHAGHSASHIRFYLIYGHHRRELNLTDKGLQQTSDKLDALKGMVNELTTHEGSATKENGAARRLIAGLLQSFRKSMNEDLNVGVAFDKLFDSLTSLMEFKQKGMLRTADSEEILEKTNQVDQVLQVIYV